jgi:esterase/lipase superfamily enzyme
MRRRTYLKGVAAGGALAAGAGTVSAGGKNDDDVLAAPADYPGVSTRDHFSINWYGGVDLEEGERNYDLRGDWDANDDGDELVLVVHGWNSDDDEDDDIDRAYTAERALAEQGFEETTAVYTWDADKGGGIDDGWYEAQEIAERNGPKLANFVTDWNDEDGRPIRLVAHSLGAQVVCSATSVLRSWGRADAVADVVLLGGAADNEACAVDGEYGPGLEYAAEQVLNCHKTDDAVLEWAYSLGELNTAVGEDGVDGSPPANYDDVDVTDVVPDHYSYPDLQDGGGCMDVVVENW